MALEWVCYFSGSVRHPFFFRIFPRLFLHHGPDQFGSISSLSDVRTRELRIALGHLDVGMTKKLCEFVEIAAIHQCDTGTIKTRVFRAMRQLSDIYFRMSGRKAS